MDAQTAYDFRSARKAFSRIGIALVMFFIATFAAQLLFEAVCVLLFPDFLKNGITPQMAVIISSATMYLVGAPVFYLCLKGLDTFEGTVEKCSLATLGTAFVISYSLSYLGQMMGDYVSAFIYSTMDIELVSETLEIISQISWVDALVFSAIIGPFFEELIFRKLIIDRTRGYGEKLAVIFSALMFAFFHMSVQQFFYTFLIGLLYGYLYIRKGKLIYCFALHAAFNFLGAVVPLMFAEYVPGYDKFLTLALDENAFEELYQMIEQNLFAYGIVAWYSLATLAMSFVGIFWFTKRYRTMRFERAAFELPRDSEGTTAFVNVGVILFIALAIAYPFLGAVMSAFI